MRHLALLTVLYALVAVIALPGTLSASQDVVPHEGLETVAVRAEPDRSSPEVAASESPGGPGSPGAAEEEPTAGAGSEPSAGVEPAPGAGVETAPATEAPAAGQEPAGAPQPAGAQQPAPGGPEPGAEPPAAEQQTASASEAVESRAKRGGGDKREQVRPVASAAASTNVTIRDFAFSPKSVTIDVGDTVTWTNKDTVKHSATAEDGSFDTGLLGKGRSGSNTFDEAGTFQYICKPHPFMKGTITVRAASSGGGDGDGDDSSSSSGSSSTGSSSSSGSGSSSGSNSGSSSTGSGSSSTGSGSTSTLPNTGGEPATLAIIGLLMLALGVAVQRRAHDGDSRPTGRTGW